MKAAAFRVGGERRVGLADEARRSVAPFDFPLAEADKGVLALIERGSPPPTPFSEITLEAPLPRPPRNIFCVGKNDHEHAREFASSGFDSWAGVPPRRPVIEFRKVMP